MERLEAKTENNHKKMEAIQQKTEASAILGGTAIETTPETLPKRKLTKTGGLRYTELAQTT